MLVETGGQHSRTGGLSVTLAGPDGRIFGGSVAGVLTAASPVQVSLFLGFNSSPNLNHFLQGPVRYYEDATVLENSWIFVTSICIPPLKFCN